MIVAYIISGYYNCNHLEKRGKRKSRNTRSVQKYLTIFFPAVSNHERVGKLTVVVEGTFMLMREFLLPRNTAGCVCRCQIAVLVIIRY
jgi:hypothetical protein